jgi:hypothetical protein
VHRVTLTSGSYRSAAEKLTSNSATIGILAGALPLGDDPLTVNYTPDSAGSSVLNSASGASLVTVTKVPIGSEAGYLAGSTQQSRRDGVKVAPYEVRGLEFLHFSGPKAAPD